MKKIKLNRIYGISVFVKCSMNLVDGDLKITALINKWLMFVIDFFFFSLLVVHKICFEVLT